MLADFLCPFTPIHKRVIALGVEGRSLRHQSNLSLFPYHFSAISAITTYLLIHQSHHRVSITASPSSYGTSTGSKGRAR